MADHAGQQQIRENASLYQARLAGTRSTGDEHKTAAALDLAGQYLANLVARSHSAEKNRCVLDFEGFETPIGRALMPSDRDGRFDVVRLGQTFAEQRAQMLFE